MRDIRAEIETINELVPVPGILLEVLSELSNDNVAIGRVVQLIESDPVLTARFLSAANSPFYGIRHTIDSVGRAIPLIGLRETASLAISLNLRLKMMNLEAAQQHHVDALWQHSITTASAARLVAERLGAAFTGREYTAALMHDMGKLVLIQCFPEEYEITRRMVREMGIRDFEAEEQVVAISHMEIGRFLGEKWQLPADFVEVMHRHHTPSDATANPPLSMLISLADMFAHSWNPAVPEYAGAHELRDEPAWECAVAFSPGLVNEDPDEVSASLLQRFQHQEPDSSAL